MICVCVQNKDCFSTQNVEKLDLKSVVNSFVQSNSLLLMSQKTNFVKLLV